MSKVDRRITILRSDTAGLDSLQHKLIT